MGIADVVKFVKAYSTPLLVGAALTLGVAFVHSREQIAVARANLKHYTDSVQVAVRADSVLHAQRDSVAQAALASLRASKNAIVAASVSLNKRADSAEAALAVAKTKDDTISAQAQVIDAQKGTIKGLFAALATSDSINAVQEGRIRDLKAGIASLNVANAALIAKLNQQAKHPLLSSTPVKTVETVLAAYGAYKLVKGQ